MQYDTSKLTPTVAEREEAMRLHDAYEEDSDAFFQALEGDASNEEVGRLARAKEAAQKARECNPVILELADDDNLLRCALSGLPIVEGDDLLEDDTGQCVLRALVLPSREEANLGLGKDVNGHAEVAEVTF